MRKQYPQVPKDVTFTRLCIYEGNLKLQLLAARKVLKLKLHYLKTS